MVINENTRLLGFERKMRLLKKYQNKNKRNHTETKNTNKALLEYAASKLKSMGLKNV